MKLSLVSLCLFAMVGCASRQLPPQNYGITETHVECDHGVCDKVTQTTYPDGRTVTVRPIHDQPKVMGTVVDDNPYEDDKDEKPVSTWTSKTEADELAMKRLQDAIRDAVKRDSCKCMPGDPLCSCL